MRDPQTHASAFPAGTLKPLAGATELAVAEAAAGPGSRPERVTGVLSAIYGTIAGEPATPELVRSLCTGAREWLLQQAAHRLHPSLGWFEARCELCREPYDLALSVGSAGREEGGSGFPVADVETGLGTRRFEAPNGHHEEAWARRVAARVLATELEPRRFFAAVCGLADDARDEAERFDEGDLERIDAVLEELSPEVADSVVSSCPSCGEPTSARLEPLGFGFPDALEILREVHLIAGHYAWPEDLILALPATRRAAYASFIAQSSRPAAGRAL